MDLKALPVNLRGGAERWINNGIIPGSFLRAVIENDLKGAFGRADENSRNNLFHIVAFFYNNAPSECWGSVDKVKEWAKTGGLKGHGGDDV